MATTLEGDYSKYPEPIREPFSRIAGETLDLRQAWLIYHRLFMDNERLTDVLSEQLGPFLGVVQTTLEDLMFLSLARLTDKDSRRQPNLSIWTLREAVPFAKSASFGTKVDESLKRIWTGAADIRAHRHKRIAHFDRAVSLKITALPIVKFTALKTILEMVEEYLNLFFGEFEETTMTFAMLSISEITGKTEIAALKAQAYDNLVRSGKIDAAEWRRQWRALNDRGTSNPPSSSNV